MSVFADFTHRTECVFPDCPEPATVQAPGQTEPYPTVCTVHRNVHVSTAGSWLDAEAVTS